MCVSCKQEKIRKIKGYSAAAAVTISGCFSSTFSTTARKSTNNNINTHLCYKEEGLFVGTFIAIKQTIRKMTDEFRVMTI